MSAQGPRVARLHRLRDPGAVATAFGFVRNQGWLGTSAQRRGFSPITALGSQT